VYEQEKKLEETLIDPSKISFVSEAGNTYWKCKCTNRRRNWKKH
jgi:hypothetical protein